MKSAKLLLLLSFIFSVIFVGFGTCLVILDAKLVLLIPFITAEVLVPLPSFVISIIGFNLNRKARKEKASFEVSDKLKE